jgi:hypothetical protein
MVKDNTRKGYSSLPFEQIPCLLQPMLYSGWMHSLTPMAYQIPYYPGTC